MRHAERGISLVEVVITIVLISLAAAFITLPYSTFLSSLTQGETIRRAAQLAQECADAALGKRRPPDGTYAALVIGTYTADEANNPCRSSQIALDAGYTRTVAICDASSAGSCANAACTVGWNCKRVDVTVTGSGYSSTVAFMAVDY